MPRLAIALAMLLAVASSSAMAAQSGTRDEAVAMVNLVRETLKAKGAEATFKAISDWSGSAGPDHQRDRIQIPLNRNTADCFAGMEIHEP